MKPMSLNMSKMKKIAGDKKTSTFKHDDGHTIVILHAALPAVMRKQIEKLPLAEGGDVKKFAEGGEAEGQPCTNPNCKSYGKVHPNCRCHGGYAKGGEVRTVCKAKGHHHPSCQLYADGGKATGSPDAKPDSNPEQYDQTWSNGVKNLKNAFGYAEGGELDAPETGDPGKMRAKADYAQHDAERADEKEKYGQPLVNIKEMKAYADPTEPVSADDSAPTIAVPDATTMAPMTAQSVAPPVQAVAPKVQAVEPTTALANTDVNANVGATPQTITIQNPNGTTNAPQAAQIQETAEREKQAVDEAAGRSKATVEDAYAKQRAAIAQRDQDAFTDFKKHTDEFKQYVSDNPIDPNHYMENRSSGQKVAGAIGLFLGGFKQGFSGGVNPAMTFINNQIDRDIESQKARSDQQRTIWGAYKDLYGDSNVANNLAKVSLNDIYTHKMNEAAAKLATPAAKANADAFAAQKAIENQQLLLNSTNDSAVPRSGGTHINGTNTPNGQRRSGGAPSSTPSAAAKGSTPSKAVTSDHLLKPGANEAFQRMQLDPRYKADLSEVQSQLEAASQADKAIDSIKEHFPAMYSIINTGGVEPRPGTGVTGNVVAAGVKTLQDLPGYIHKKAEGLEGIPYVGPAIAGLGKFATDTDSNRKYDVHRDAMLSAITSALTKGGFTPSAAHDAANDMLPVEGDSLSGARLKMATAIEKVKKAVSHNALDRHRLTQTKSK